DLGDLGGSDLGDLGDLGGSDLGDLGGSDLGDLGGADLGDLGGADLGDLGGADLGDLGELGGADDSAGLVPDDSFPGLDAGLESDSFDTGGFESAGFDTGDFGGDGLGLDTSDLADMSQTAMMSTGIGDEFTDEELAKLRTQLLDYSPGVRKAVIDAIVNEKISSADQRRLTHMLVEQANDDAVASFIEQHLGYRPDTALPDRTRDGVPILYTEDVTPEALQRRRRRAYVVAGTVAASILAAISIFGGMYLWRAHSISGIYEMGLEELREAEKESGEQRLKRREAAESYYKRALEADDGNFNVEYMNKYGIGYMKAGFYEEAFTKLFGKVEPSYDWSGDMRAPLIRTADGSRWFSEAEQRNGSRTRLLSADNRIRELIEPGAYTVSRLRDGQMDRENLIALARFHSGITYSFVNSDEGKKYKNDSLAVDYYRLILTLLGRPADADAMAGIGRIYYNRGEYGTAAREYQKILDQNPAEVAGHAGLLETYIEIWRQNGDPRFVIEKHRQIQRLGLESDMPIFVLSKLAGFYVDLDSDDLRIRYQIDPVDTMSGLDLDDNAVNLLGIVFDASEARDGQTIEGTSYAAGYYQRGRYLNVRKEHKRAVKQFQNAYQYDARFYPALNEIGDYYADILDFDRAKEYYLKAIESYEQNYRSYGMHPEDEIFVQYDRGIIYYNLASLVFMRYAGIEHRDLPVTNRIYPESGLHDEPDDDRRSRLYEAGSYLEKGLEIGLKNAEARRESLFWLGWIPYVQGDFKEAMRRWSELDREYEESPANANLNFGKANAAFHTDQYRTALGYYLKLRDELEPSLKDGSPQDERQKMSYYLLYSVYNNLGAVYEAEFLEKRDRGAPRRELDKLETKGLTHYMKAIEIAREAGFVPEKAMANKELAFRDRTDRKPLIEDWLNPVVSEK
ncbi:MAG: hypothetical protein CVV45_17230, partial [Spirochaetae bacterium HGW-Spirochaetae-10]